MPPSADPSIHDVLENIARHAPDTPFLALGQTALWDEPTKAVWRRLLDQFRPEATLIAGVHDTDYFAKTAAHLEDDQTYIALPHDDGRTRDLWSAAGELSALFGSESVPTRQMFLSRGIPFDWLAQGYPGGKDALYADKTVAWGWRGIVSTASHSIIAHDVPVREMQDALLEQLDWGIGQSIASLASPEAREGASRIAGQMRGWVTDFLADCSADCRLSDLYQTLLPRLYTLLLNSQPAKFQTTASTELFRFNSQTCRRPRFGLLQAFLAPGTREMARRAYDRAVGGSGSGIYTLDHFGPGAIPFDVVLPGRGRGTLRVSSAGLTIETAPTVTELQSGPVRNVDELAYQLEDAFGQDVVLVGKAVTLVDMIAAEYLIVFHETASGYTNLTQAFNARLVEGGFPLTLRPIVRLTYPTWDSLAAAPDTTVFQLPTHLAQAFGRETVPAPQFAAEWRSVCEVQRNVLRECQALRKTRDLLHYLEGKDDHCWCDRLAEYEQALGTLKGIAAKSQTLADREAEHREELRLWQSERQGLERRKGDDWRQSVEPLREKIQQAEARGEETQALCRDRDRQVAIRATAFDEPLHICRERIRATQRMLTEFRRQRRLMERSPEALAARATLTRIVRDAQLARLDLVRSAYLTVEGLEHTDLRPTAWWLPLVDPSGDWFAAIAQGTKARLEWLTT